MWVTSLGLAGEAGIFASQPFYPMFSGVPNGPLRLSPPQVHAAVHNSGTYTLFRSVRDRLLKIPERVCHQIASETDDKKIARIIKDELNLALVSVSHAGGTEAISKKPA